MRRRAIIPALFLIALGLYLLLRELAPGLPGWGGLWPVFPLAGGVAFLWAFFAGRRSDPGQVFLGVAGILVGIFFFFITLGPLDYPDLEQWWPVFVLIGGLAFVAQWLASRLRDWGALFLGIVALAVGGVAMAITFNLLGPDSSQQVIRLWPLALILLGLMFLLRAVFSGRRERS